MTPKTKPKPKTLKRPADQYYNWAVPPTVQAGYDPLVLRLDFHDQAVVMHTFDQRGASSVRIVSALDVAHALASELNFSTGLLPVNVLWWVNTSRGAVIALWEEPRVRKVALQEQPLKPPRRFTIPLPGLIFLCIPQREPWVFAAKRRPTKASDLVYRAPLANIFDNGRSCPGSHKYPDKISEIPDSFFRSFFSPAAELRHRSKKYPDNVVKLWETIDGKETFPLDDLVDHGRVENLMEMNLKE